LVLLCIFGRGMPGQEFGYGIRCQQPPSDKN
jgi:hypothetical protein